MARSISQRTYYNITSILSGDSPPLRERTTEADIEIIMQGAREKYPEARPRIISDNGPQLIARDFKEFIRISGVTHVRTSPLPPIEQKNRRLSQIVEKRV